MSTAYLHLSDSKISTTHASFLLTQFKLLDVSERITLLGHVCIQIPRFYFVHFLFYTDEDHTI